MDRGGGKPGQPVTEKDLLVSDDGALPLALQDQPIYPFRLDYQGQVSIFIGLDQIKGGLVQPPPHRVHDLLADWVDNSIVNALEFDD